MTRQQLLWLFIWIFIFFLMFCIWNKLQDYPSVEKAPVQNIHTTQKKMHFKVLKENSNVILSGIIASEAEKETLIDAYGKAFDNVKSDNLIVDNTVSSTPLLSFFENFADNFSHFDSGYIEYHDKNLEIDGMATHNIVAQTLSEQLAELKNINIDNTLTIEDTSNINENNATLAEDETNVEAVTIKTDADIQNEIDTLLKEKRVQFLYARDILTNDSQNLVDKLISILLKNKKINLEIAGHTDSDGTRKNNLNLSKRRAQSIKTYMIKHGIDASRLRAVGYGESQPLVVNNSLKNKQINRRVEFKVRGE